MNPAPNATKCSMSRRPRTACRTTASPPSTLPSAARSAYHSALDTGQEKLFGVAGRVLQHVRQQALQRLANARPRPHASGEQIGTIHREVSERQGILGGADGLDNPRELDWRLGEGQKIIGGGPAWPHAPSPVLQRLGVL